MKILLVSSNIAATPYPVYPLGMGVIAHALTAAGHEVRQFDFLESGKSIAALTREVVEFAPSFVGVSVRNIDNVNLVNEQRYVDVVRDIVAQVKNARAVPVVLGGTGFSVMPEEILQATGADYGVVGEGEAAIVDFAQKCAANNLPRNRILRSATALSSDEMAPALYDPRIIKFYQASGNMVNVQTKRGCTYRCVYCTYPVLEGRTFRPRAAGVVVDDIERLIHEHTAQYIFFTDSIFNDDEGNYLKVVEEMKRRGISVPWTAFFKPDGLAGESIALMKATGLVAAEIGADAASDTTLAGLGKQFCFADIVSANELFVKHGVATAHYYMFGGPGETQETVREGIRNILSIPKTVSFVFMGIRILPGTPLEAISRRDGVLREGVSFLEPVYYLAPGLSREWLEATLTDAFSKTRNVIFPPDKFEATLQFLHKMGFAGSLWDMLLDERASARTSRQQKAG